MQKRVLLVTGTPGVGKTTVLIKTVEALKAKGIGVGGMISREAREGNVRVGFEILDLTSGKHGWLAHVNQKSGSQVGKYRVNSEDLENIGAKSITEAVDRCQVVAIDEIGPMEIFSQKFKQATKQSVGKQETGVSCSACKSSRPVDSWAKQREDAETFTVTFADRDVLGEELVKRA